MLRALSDLNKIRSMEAVVDGLLVASLHLAGIQAMSQEMYSLTVILFVASGAAATKIIANEKIFSFFMRRSTGFLATEFALYCTMAAITIASENPALRWAIMGVLFSVTSGVRGSMWEKVKENAKNGRTLEINNEYSYQSGMVIGLAMSFVMGFFMGARIDITSAVLLDTYTTGMSAYGFWRVVKATKALD